MSLWVFDTDSLTLWLRGHETITARVAQTSHHQLAITIITIDEVLRGWYTQIRRARHDEQLARAYQALQETVEFSRAIRILPFDLASIRRYRQLRINHRRTGTNDLRIAAIVLEQEGALVTRNSSDFVDIDGLLLADWSQASQP
ncbi:MAG: type II toxin-antitoxin system VapC family toxin [Candidatus Tectomicrobia bacterium]|nr:type II toxin-antitoxin system VapC family toxin [Candidatus Tectomicrobia bacterium]